MIQYLLLTIVVELVSGAEQDDRIQNYTDFYPFYLTQHSKPSTKLFHFVGTSVALGLLYFFLTSRGKGQKPQWSILVWGVICGYFFAWVSHFLIEENKPATFKYPLWSLFSDFRLWFEILLGKH